MVPDAIRAAGFEVKEHDDLFEANTPDPVWIREVGRQGWVALSHNKRIGTTEIERDAAMRAGLPLIFLIGKHNLALIATNFAVSLPRVIPFVEKYQGPYLAKLHYPSPFESVGKKPGRIRMWLTEQAWLKVVRR